MPILVDLPITPIPEVKPRWFAELIWSYLPEYVKEADDGTLLAYITAIASPFEDVLDWLMDPENAVDPEKAPFEQLQWIGALGGVDVSGVPNVEVRSFLADPTVRTRGNRKAIKRRVGLTLTGTKSIQIECPLEGDPWAILVRTFAAETPDPVATETAVRTEIPAWLALTFEVADGIDYNELALRYPTYDDMTNSGKTYQELSKEI